MQGSFCCVLLVFMLNCVDVFAFPSGDTELSLPGASPQSWDNDTHVHLLPNSEGHISYQVSISGSHHNNFYFTGLPRSSSISSATDPIVTTIRDDYEVVPGIGAHKLHNDSATWNDARKICIEEGGNLAVINSNAEAEHLVKLLNSAGPLMRRVDSYGAAYVGVHDFFQEGEWITVEGESLARAGFSRWTDRWSRQPNKEWVLQNCGLLLEDGGLDSTSCSVQRPYFCEISLNGNTR